MRVSGSAIKASGRLGFVWDTLDPFLFCVHHHDHFPGGRPDGTLEPKYLRGRQLGSDFVVKDGFRLYHGTNGVPGFPSHPHRGFETITIIRKGLCDHSDSLGAKARFGGAGSDTQWVTTGKGLQHAEMFPCEDSKSNEMLLFQIWLNLPAKNKMTDPYFTMLWGEQNPVVKSEDGSVSITVIADENKTLQASPQPAPPDSWASESGSDVAIYLIDFDKSGSWTLPAAASPTTNRRLFFFEGGDLTIDGKRVEPGLGFTLDPTVDVPLSSTGKASLLLLQGKPIGEPVVQQGPFVVNSQAELQQTYRDYQKTQFGGWPWKSSDPTHVGKGRFAVHPDGKEEYPGSASKDEL